MDSVNAVSSLIGEGVSLLLMLIAVWFYGRSIAGLMEAMIDVGLGAPGAMARFIRDNIFALFMLLLALTSPQVSSVLIRWGVGQGAPTKMSDLNSLMAAPNSALKAAVLVTVLLFFLIMALILLQTSAGVMAGNSQAISQGVWSAFQIILVLIIGSAFIGAGIGLYRTFF